MNNIFAIIKKELKRFFGDKRMLLSLIVPGLLIYVVYGLMGNIMNDVLKPDQEHIYKIEVINNAYSESGYFDSNDKYTIEYDDEIFSAGEISDGIKVYKDKLENGELDLLIVFQEEFSNVLLEGETKPWMDMYYNSTSNESSEIFMYYATIFSSIGTEMKFDINAKEDTSYDLATKEETSAKVITMILPYILIIFLFTGCLSISSESIAGEKERGTIATLLVTPTRRQDIAIGKITALSITSMVSAAVSFLGLLLSLPKLLGGTGNDLTLEMYSFATYVEIFFLLIVTVMFFTTILSLISTLAKTIKEASSYSSVIMVIVTLVGISSMLGSSSTNLAVYFIPIYNIVQCMTSIFSLEFNGLFFLITILSNIVYIAIGIVALTKMFNSEKIMFAK